MHLVKQTSVNVSRTVVDDSETTFLVFLRTDIAGNPVTRAVPATAALLPQPRASFAQKTAFGMNTLVLTIERPH